MVASDIQTHFPRVRRVRRPWAVLWHSFRVQRQKEVNAKRWVTYPEGVLQHSPGSPYSAHPGKPRLVLEPGFHESPKMNSKYLCTPLEHRISRREWLGGIAAAGVSGWSQPALAETLKKKNKQVLFIWLDGGISQLESWDPKPNSPFGGPFRAIPTSVPGIQHQRTAAADREALMHHLAVVRSLCTKDDSHSAGVARIQRGDPKNRGVTYPYLRLCCRKAAGFRRQRLPPYVWIKPGNGGFIPKDAGFLGAKVWIARLRRRQAPENLLRPRR